MNNSEEVEVTPLSNGYIVRTASREVLTANDSKALLQQNAPSTSQTLKNSESQQKIIVWGSNLNGQLGLGNGQEKVLSQPLKMPFMRQVTKVSLGASHSAFITDQAQLFMTGDNRVGQLGIGSEKIQTAVYPTMVASLAQRHVTDVACGKNHTLVLTGCKTVFTCGANDFGQLGLNCPDTEFSFEIFPQKIRAEAIFAGDNQSFMLSDSRVLACGDNSRSKLGLQSDQPFLNQFVQLPIGQISQISTSEYQTLALQHSGRVLETKELEGFIQVQELKNISQVQAGTQLNGALQTDGSLWCWSPLSSNQLQNHKGFNLQQMCIGAQDQGLARDRSDNLYNWSLGGVEKLNKKAQQIYQGGLSSIIIKKEQSPIKLNLKQFVVTGAASEFQTEGTKLHNSNQSKQQLSHPSSATMMNKSASLMPFMAQQLYQQEIPYENQYLQHKITVSPTEQSERTKTLRLKHQKSGLSSKRTTSTNPPQLQSASMVQVNQQPLGEIPPYSGKQQKQVKQDCEPSLTELNSRHRSTGPTLKPSKYYETDLVYNKPIQKENQKPIHQHQMTTASLSDIDLPQRKSKKSIQITHLTQEIQRLKIENEDLQHKNERMTHYQTSRLDVIAKEDTYLRQVLAHTNQKNQQLSDQLKSVQDTCRQQEEQARDSLLQSEKLRDTLSQLQHENHGLKSQIRELQEQANMQVEVLRECKDKQKEWKHRYRKSQQEKYDSQRMLEDGNQHIQQLQANIDQQHQTIKNLNTQIKEMNSQVEHAEDRLRQAQEKQREYFLMCEQKDDHHKNLTRIIEELEHKNKQLFRYLDRLNCEDAQSLSDQVQGIISQKRRSVQSIPAANSSLRQPFHLRNQSISPPPHQMEQQQHHHHHHVPRNKSVDEPQFYSQQHLAQPLLYPVRPDLNQTTRLESISPPRMTEPEPSFSPPPQRKPVTQSSTVLPSQRPPQQLKVQKRGEPSNNFSKTAEDFMHLNKLTQSKPEQNYKRYRDNRVNRSTEIPNSCHLNRQSKRQKRQYTPDCVVGGDMLEQPKTCQPSLPSRDNSAEQMHRISQILNQPRKLQDPTQNLQKYYEPTKSQRVGHVSSLVTQQAMRKELLNMSTALANLRKDHQDVRHFINKFD